MNALLQLIDISYAHSHERLFEGLNFNINPKDKIGLVGYNGTGKSTLLALVNGQLELDKGEIRKPNFAKIVIVEQFVPQALLPLSLLEAVIAVLPIEEKSALSWKAENQLMKLGFLIEQFNHPVMGLSGGQQNLMLIARAIILEPDLLLMDEPGNHMDITAMTKLQQFLQHECACPFLLISHDQHLLDNVCQKTLFLRDKKIYQFELPFNAALAQLEEADRVAEKRRLLEEKEIGRLKATAKRLAIWGRENDNEDLSRKAKSIEKRAEKLSQNKTQVSSGSGLKLALTDHSLEAKQILALEQCKIKTPDGSRLLLTVEQIFIRPGDRVALLGVNGVGKSSTLQTIRKTYAALSERSNTTNLNTNNLNINNLGESDNIRFNPRVELGYYDQELSAFDQNTTRIEWLRQHTPANEEQLKRALINSGIKYQDFDRKVDSLSGGEKARMMFLSFSLNQPKFLILDEPTNHIDLQGKQQLTQQLMNSGATLLITSHDRYFLDQIATRWLLIEDGKIIEVTSSESFYDNLIQQTDTPGECQGIIKPSATTILTDEEDILRRIEELEKKLSEDKKRKLKFQKLKLQSQWQSELEALWQKIS